MLVYDAETDGLLAEVTKIHCINMIDTVTGSHFRYTDNTHYHCGTPTKRDGTIKDALRRLEDAPEIGGQNVIGYDNPVFDKLYGFAPKGRIRDSLVESSVIWTNMADHDFNAIRKGTLPLSFQKKGLIGRHSLKAWGYRLDPNGTKGFRKDDFDPKHYGYTWKTVPFLREMDDYCDQDNVVCAAWFAVIDAKNYAETCLRLECEVARIISKQTRDGFAFDVDAGQKLHAELLKQKLALEDELRDVYEPWEVVTKRAISKVNNRKLGRVKGEEYVVKKTLIFNPGSRDHIADRLKVVNGWQPTEFTANGKPKVDEEILSALPWPQAKRICEYLTCAKRLGQLAEGKEAWLKAVRNGRIHGRVNTNGTVTGRMSHYSPNVAQADKWKPMRSLWIVPKGRVLVGCDAEGLELRVLGHYMARYDGGAYSFAVVNGKKEDQTDVHNVNRKGAGLNSRDSAKTFIYALIYGAGDFKLGSIVFDDMTPTQQEAFNSRPPTLKNRERALATLGKARRARLMDQLPALARLTEDVKKRAKATGFLKGLDGRLLHVRSEHSALNTLLQSGGAVAMKQALVMLDEHIRLNPHLQDTLFVANVHDEFQMEANPEYAHELGTAAADCIRRAGEFFTLRCPLAGAFDIGSNWAETH